jgi:putative ABC transport system permease protein
MSVWESFVTAIHAIFSNKLRSALTMLGIVIGVCAVVLLVALGQGFQTSMKTTFENMGASALYISPNQDRTVKTMRFLTNDDVQALRDQIVAPSIDVVSPTRSRSLSVSYGNNNVTVQGQGVTTNILKIRNYTIASGRFLSEQDIEGRENVTVLGWQTAQDLFGNDSPIDKYIRVAGDKYQVIGTFEKMGGFAGDSYMLIPLSTMQSRIVGGTNVQQIAIKAVSPDKVDSAIAEITAIMRNQHYIRQGATDDFTIRDMREVMKSMEDTLAAFSIFMSSVGAISLIVGSIGIMNIMLVSVSERTREIGIRKAIGAKRRDILRQFLIEAASLSFTGGLIGLAIGIGTSMAMGKVQMGNSSIQPEVSPGIVILALAVSIGTGLISGTYPATRAARLDPIESLRHE